MLLFPRRLLYSHTRTDKNEFQRTVFSAPPKELVKWGDKYVILLTTVIPAMLEVYLFQQCNAS